MILLKNLVKLLNGMKKKDNEKLYPNLIRIKDGKLYWTDGTVAIIFNINHPDGYIDFHKKLSASVDYNVTVDEDIQYPDIDRVLLDVTETPEVDITKLLLLSSMLDKNVKIYNDELVSDEFNKVQVRSDVLPYGVGFDNRYLKYISEFVLNYGTKYKAYLRERAPLEIVSEGNYIIVLMFVTK